MSGDDLVSLGSKSQVTTSANVNHDDVIKWKHFPRYWPFVRGIQRSPVNSPHKGQWREALMFSLTCVWKNGWVNNREAGDLRRYRAHYNVIVRRTHWFNHWRGAFIWGNTTIYLDFLSAFLPHGRQAPPTFTQKANTVAADDLGTQGNTISAMLLGCQLKKRTRKIPMLGNSCSQSSRSAVRLLRYLFYVAQMEMRNVCAHMRL